MESHSERETKGSSLLKEYISGTIKIVSAEIVSAEDFSGNVKTSLCATID